MGQLGTTIDRFAEALRGGAIDFAAPSRVPGIIGSLPSLAETIQSQEQFDFAVLGTGSQPTGERQIRYPPTDETALSPYRRSMVR